MILLVNDPGVSGGFALHDNEGKDTCYSMPDTNLDIIDLIDRLFAKYEGEEVKVWIEKVTGYVGKKNASLKCHRCGSTVWYEKADPASFMFTFGDNHGFVRACIMKHTKKEPEYIHPRTWLTKLGLQKPTGMVKHQWKSHLLGVAKNMYPGLKPSLKTCDALLMLQAVITIENTLFNQIPINQQIKLPF